jgi:hypothetical protein
LVIVSAPQAASTDTEAAQQSLFRREYEDMLETLAG